MKNRILLTATLAFTFWTLNAQSLKDGLKAIDFERYEASRDIFKALLAKDLANGDYYYYLGQSYLNLLNIDSAEMSFKDGIMMSKTNPANYAGLGEVELVQEHKDKAKEYFDKALAFSKNRYGIFTDLHAITLVASGMVNNSGIKMLDEAEELIKMGYEQSRRDYDLLIAGGDVYLEKNDGGNSATFYERAIALDPNNPKAYCRVSVIWLRVRNYESAQADLNRAFERDPNYAPALKYQAELFYAQKKFDKAKEMYTRYLQNSERSNSNQIKFARILFLSKEYDEALVKIDEIQKTDKTTLLLYRLRGHSIGEILETTTDPELAKSGLSSMEYYFQKQDPKKLGSNDYEYLGKLQAKSGGMDSLAIANLKKAMDLNSYNLSIYLDLAKIYNKSKMFDSAAASYESYISKSKKSNIAEYFLMGRAYYNAKIYGKADSAFIKVNELNPNWPDAYLWRGNANSGMDPDFEAGFAKGFYEKYISLLTADPEKFESTLKIKNKAGLINAYGYLGFYFYNKDMVAEAKEYYKKVLELDPENAKAKAVMAEKK